MSVALVELKAKIQDIKKLRTKLFQIGASFIGKFDQKDTYFNIDKGRLKIRETEGKDVADIVFYERPDLADIKKSQIILVKTRSPTSILGLFSKLFPIKTVVKKTREIYRLEDTQVHLDYLFDLGTFLEFEHPVNAESSEVKKARELLKEYCKKLDIKKRDLQAYSYSDLLSK